MTFIALGNLAAAAIFAAMFAWKRDPIFVGLAVLNGGIFLGLMMRANQ